MTNGESDVRVECRLAKVRETSVWIAVKAGRGEREVNIPRSLIYGPDEIELEESLPLGGNVTLRIFRWKAEQEGLLNMRNANAASGDLFGKDR